MTMERLIGLESISEEAARMLRLLVRAGYNIFVSGGTGSGKTTFLNALSEYIPREQRIVTIEDSAELQMHGIPNLVRLETVSYTHLDVYKRQLQEVTINSSLNQACWADLEGEEVTEPVASIKELNDVYNVILLDYIFSSVGENGQLEYYNVEEYYRVRVGPEKIYLLSFERTVEEIFRGEGNHIGGDSIHLGIRSGNVDFKANETGNIICFVQQLSLIHIWSAFCP